MNRTFPAQPTSLCEIRSAVRETALRYHLGPSPLQDLLLAVTEAGSNVILHTASPTIEVSARAVLDTFNVTIRDQGVFQWGIRPQHGFGMPLMERLSDSISVQAGTPEHPGTTIELTKRLPNWQEG